MVIFTSICANYLHKARTLAESVKDNIPDAIFIVCLLETSVDPQYHCPHFDRIVLAKDAWNGNFGRFIFKHSIVEASTSVKGRFFQYLYENYPDEDKFVYLDPDIYVYADLVELKSAMEIHPIILCPHLLQPGNIDMELSGTAHGVYNLGFLAVNNSQEAHRFIDWWAERLYLFCYDDIARGIFTDQKWVDLAPCFFDVLVFKHRGYDFAPWSLLDCEMLEKDGNYFIHGDPLRFIHFSGFGRVAEKCMNDWLPEGPHPFRDLYNQYAQEHDNNNDDNISKTPWSYGCYHSGEAIDDAIRQVYKGNYDVMFSWENPFEHSNQFWREQLDIGKSKLKICKYIEKCMQIWKREGFISLLKRVWSKVFDK